MIKRLIIICKIFRIRLHVAVMLIKWIRIQKIAR
jgi:hypothetical protein